MSAWWRYLWLILTVAALAALVGVAMLLSRGADSALAELQPAPVPITVAAEETVVDYARQATLSTAARELVELPASAHQGVITGVTAAAGDMLANGDEVYRVDDVAVRVLVDDQVLYRPVGAKATASEISAVQRFLIATGFLDAEPSGSFGPSTAAAVKQYAKSMRFPGAEFLPGWVVWTPRDSVVMEVGQRLGARVSPVAAVVRPPVTAFAVDTTDGGPAGEWVFAYQGQLIAMALDEAGEWRVIDEDAATALLDKLPADSRGLSGWLRLAEPGRAVAVPAAALVDSAGAVCVFSSAGTPIPVTPAGASVDGRVQVTGLEADTEVLVNPHAMGHSRCG